MTTTGKQLICRKKGEKSITGVIDPLCHIYFTVKI